VAIKTVKTLDIKMPYPIEMKRLMGKWRCRAIHMSMLQEAAFARP
jgi:hypothetical protein